MIQHIRGDHRVLVENDRLLAGFLSQCLEVRHQFVRIDHATTGARHFAVEGAVDRGVVAGEIHQKQAILGVGGQQVDVLYPLSQSHKNTGKVALAKLVGFAAAHHQRSQVGVGDAAVARDVINDQLAGELLPLGQQVELMQLGPGVDFHGLVELVGNQQLHAGGSDRAVQGHADQLGGVGTRDRLSPLDGLNAGDGVAGGKQFVEVLCELCRLAGLVRQDDWLVQVVLGQCGQ